MKRKLLYIARSLNVANLLLAVILAFFVFYLIAPARTARLAYRLPAAVKSAAVKGEEAKKAAAERSPSPSDYTVIADQNLFYKDRIIPVAKVEAPPLPKPEFVLYGTIITDDLKMAYMEDKKAPQKSPSRGARQTAVKLNGTLSGFTLKAIAPDTVLMVRGEEKIAVLLEDPAKPKTREAAVAAAPPQTPPQPGAAVSPQSSDAAASRNSAARRRIERYRQRLEQSRSAPNRPLPSAGSTTASPLNAPKWDPSNIKGGNSSNSTSGNARPRGGGMVLQ